MALSLLVQGERLLAHSAPGLAAAWGQARGTPGRLGWDPLACVLSGTRGAGVRASSELVRAAGLWPGCSFDLSGSAGEAGWPARGSTFVCAPSGSLWSWGGAGCMWVLSGPRSLLGGSLGH